MSLASLTRFDRITFAVSFVPNDKLAHLRIDDRVGVLDSCSKLDAVNALHLENLYGDFLGLGIDFRRIVLQVRWDEVVL